ncbi:MAG TPA: AraC family transcriptional regulator [Chitinolyticbacter sp.]|nr:AraC family transcriptional regulator [Chitinolyticbacter sp.]
MGQSPELLRRLLRAKDRIDEAPHEDWLVPHLAQISAVSPAHFARAFKQAFGVPPHRYVLTRRIERATALLRETDLPITQIAFQTGWTSLGTFGRVFQDINGASPSEFRERAQAEALGLQHVPECILRAAHRPDLTTAVSEKRQQKSVDITTPPTELPSKEGI